MTLKDFTQNYITLKYSFCLSVVQVTLKFTYVENYPDEAPLWEIQSQENLEDRDTEDILSLLQQQVCDHVRLNNECDVTTQWFVGIRFEKKTVVQEITLRKKNLV